MSTTVVQHNPPTKRHGVKLSLSTPDLRHFFGQPNPHDSNDRLPPSTNCPDDASLTRLPSAQKIRRKRYGSSQSVTLSSDADSSKLSSSNERVGINGDLVQPVPTSIVLQRSMSVDSGISFNLDFKSPTSASATLGSTTYPLPYNSISHSRPSVALHDDANTPCLVQCEIQKQDSLDCPTANLNTTTSTTPAQLPELTPFSPAFSISFYHTQSSSPTQFRFGSAVHSSNSSTGSLPKVSLPPSPSPSRVSFIQPPKSVIPPAIAPPRRSSLYLGPLFSPPSPASSQFSRHTVSSSHHASTSSLASGSQSSLPLSPLTPSIPITPPPEVLKRKRMEKLERTLGVQDVGSLAITESGSGSGGVQEPGVGQGRDKAGNDVRDRPPRLDLLSSPSERAIIAPWDATPPPGSSISSKPKSLTRKLTKSKPPPSPGPQARVQQLMEPKSDSKLKMKRVPAPIVIVPTSNSHRSLTSDTQAVNDDSHELPVSDALSHENTGEGNTPATIAKSGTTPAILPSAPPSRSPTPLPPASSHSQSPSPPSSVSEDTSLSSFEAEVPAHSRSASVSSVSYAPTSPTRTPHPAQAQRMRPKDFGKRRRSRSVSHIYNGSRPEGIRGLNADLIVPPLPTSPLTPNSTREANITGALNSLDGHRTSGDGTRGETSVAEKDGDKAKARARRRRMIDSLGYPFSPLKSPLQSSLTSQRYIKPAARALLSSPSSSSLPHGSSTTLVAPFSSPSASSSTLNFPIPVPSVPAIPKIHILRQDQPQPQGKPLKRSTSFSLLKMSKGRKEDVHDRYERPAERDGRRMGVVDAAEEWRAQLQRSEREVLAGFKPQASGQQSRSSASSSQPPLPTSSLPASRSASRTPSRQPSRSNISIGPVHVTPTSYFPPPTIQDRAQPHHTTLFSGATDGLKSAEAGMLKPREEEYGRVDNRVCGHGWSGEWNLPLEEVIKGLRMIQSS